MRAQRRRSQRRQQASTSRIDGVRILAVVFGIVVIGLVAIMGTRNQSGPAPPDTVTPQPSVRAFSTSVQEVASKFFCGCGACDTPELADCTCPTAIEEKGLIDRELRRGMPEQKVLELVNSRYGRIKPQFASLVGSPGATETPTPQAVPPKTSEPSTPSLGFPLEAHVRQVASRFTCACGQCQNHVLSECDCEHPGGSVEMKAFIRDKIDQKRYTTGEIAKAVAYEYGHLIEK